MKKQLVSIAAAALFVVAGCGADNEEGQGTQNPNIEPAHYKNQDPGDYNGNYRDNARDNAQTRNFNNVSYNNNNDNNFNDRNDMNNNNDNNNQYDVAEEAADKIVDKIDVIDHAYVLTTDNNAYVAAKLDANNRRNLSDNGDALTDDVKDQIASIVKSVNNDIDNVYVSTNPDFVDLTNNYVDDADNGQPIEGFFDQMGNMIERLFPQNK